MTRAEIERLAFAVATEVSAVTYAERDAADAVNLALAEMAESIMAGASEDDHEAVWLRAEEILDARVMAVPDRPSRVPCQVCHGAGTCMLCDDDGMVPIECEVTT